MTQTKDKKEADLEAKRGRPPTGLTPSRKDLVRLYVKEEKSIREVAEALGRSKDMVARALKKYRIEARPNASRSQLRKIPLEDLKGAIKDKGIRGTARELGVDEGTIRHHIKGRKSIY